MIELCASGRKQVRTFLFVIWCISSPFSPEGKGGVKQWSKAATLVDFRCAHAPQPDALVWARAHRTRTHPHAPHAHVLTRTHMHHKPHADTQAHASIRAPFLLPHVLILSKQRLCARPQVCSSTLGTEASMCTHTTQL